MSVDYVVPCKVVHVKTPDGEMFVVINEDRKSASDNIQIYIGKAGSAIAAWAYALSCMINLALDHGADLTEILEDISGVSSDKLSITANATKVKSGPDGVAIALLRYLQDNAKNLTKDNHVIFRNY